LRAGLPVLEALSMIESGNNDRAVGRAGEVSRYQILPKVWRQYTQSRAYRDSTLAALVAEQHLQFLESRFRVHTGEKPSDFDQYVMWNAGVTYYKRAGFNPRRVHPIIRERANRFVNLRNLPQRPPASSTQVLAIGGFPAGN
jgi:hypothetical protein